MHTQPTSLLHRTAPEPAAQVRPNIHTNGARPAPQTISLDKIIATMVNAMEGISDLLFVVGRPPQVEAFGKLRAVEIEGLPPTLAPALVEASPSSSCKATNGSPRI